MDLNQILVIGLLFTLFVVGTVYFYYLAKCYSRVKNGNRWIFLTPFWLFSSGSFGEEGNRYRIAALKVTMVVIAIIVILFAVK
jgi:hypothetical protein